MVAAGLLAGAVVAGFTAGLLEGVARSAGHAAAEAAAASAKGDYATSIALDQTLAARRGVAYALTEPAINSARADVLATTKLWAESLAAAGRPGTALALLNTITDSGFSRRLAPLRASCEAAAAPRLVRAGDGNGAVALLDDAISAGSNPTAAAELPPALLAAARESLAAGDHLRALGTLQRLIQTYPGSPEAARAQALLAAPQPVSGTLIRADGLPLGRPVRLSSHFRRIGTAGYSTGPPRYDAVAGTTGDFSFGAVQPGGPYVLEVLLGSGWTALVDPASGRPSASITVAPLTPLDLSFIVLP